KERIESALTGLVRPGELNAVALLNAGGDVVASAGTNVDLQPRAGAIRPAEHWEQQSVTLVNLVDLGTNVTRDLEGTNPPIGLSFSKTNRPPPPPQNTEHSDNERRGSRDGDGDRRSRGNDEDGDRRRGGNNDGDRRWRFGRPPWMSEDEFKSMIERQGVHS